MAISKTIENFYVPQEFIDKWKEFVNYADQENYIKLLYADHLLGEQDFNENDNWYKDDVENYLNDNCPWFTEYLKQYHYLHTDKEKLYKKINSFSVNKKEYIHDLSNLDVHDLLIYGL